MTVSCYFQLEDLHSLIYFLVGEHVANFFCPGETKLAIGRAINGDEVKRTTCKCNKKGRRCKWKNEINKKSRFTKWLCRYSNGKLVKALANNYLL